MNTNQKIASTFLTSRMRQLLVAVLSVTFGISMYICMNSFMSGVNNEQTEMAFTALSHIKIYNDLAAEVVPIIQPTSDEPSVVIVNNNRNIHYTEGIKNVDGIKESLQVIPAISAVTAQLNQNVFLRSGVSKVSANLSGIETENEDALFGTADYLTEGDLEALNRRSNGIILGTGLARQVGVGMSDNVLVSTSDGVSKSFKVVGLIETGAQGADKTKAMVSIETARQLFSKNKSYATELLVNVNDYDAAEAVAQQIAAVTDYKVEAWQEGNGQLDSANLLRYIIAIAVSFTILVVAGFGIYNIMNMTVNEKIKEIAILKAMGFNSKDVIEIFLTQSVVIGFIGGVTGLVLGNILARIINQVPFEVGTMTTLPVVFQAQDYVMAFVFGIIITFLAGYLPARSASQVDPVAILRG